ncbi:SAVED domain-containing protein [Bremerella cremea]|uniref:SMODS-associated and fused to various effectors domain-containing protein n=1 Tax=Blastopirellula marina TaxID=124 RepID=A0A2S8G062_9BACT|nr:MULTISPECIES: SAVED domain-containing protein [Pirellulaceae]PQO37829.1 hypothetical protein C5Y83_07765 [Blastopirellula marina]RCS50217.1 SAVED domain-containing protein [Bremerella cremea]
MNSPSSARQLGDEVHQYLFWLYGCRMLAKGEIRQVGFETGEFNAFDDISVLYSQPRPDGVGGLHQEEHIQVKFSVAGGKILTGESLADPKLVNATTFSLLQRLRDATEKAEKEGRSCIFQLWCPWPVEQGSLLDELIDKSTGALRLELLFEGKTPQSKSGKLRKVWADNLELNLDDKDELSKILRPLRIHYDSRTADRIRADLSDILPTAGLLSIDQSHRADVYPLLIQRLSREGTRVFGSDILVAACKAEGLWIGKPINNTSTVRLGVRNFTQFAEGLEDETDHMICLTEFFSGRHIKDLVLWDTEVLPRLRSFLSSHLKSGVTIQFHLATLGALAFTSGYLAEPKIGAKFEFTQKGFNGTSTWSVSSSPPSQPLQLASEVFEVTPNGDDLAVAISVSQLVKQNVEDFIKSDVPQIKSLLHIHVPNVGPNSIRDGDHAFAVASKVVELIRQQTQALKYSGNIHLFWAMPNSLAFMFGQQSRLLGNLTVYEFDFEQGLQGSYTRSVTLAPDFRLP